MSGIEIEARNADLATIVSMLQDQRARRVDLVSNAPAISASNGYVRIAPGEHSQYMDKDGVTDVSGHYLPTGVFCEGLGAKLDIPGPWLRDLRTERPDLFDGLVNGRLHGADIMPDAELGTPAVHHDGKPGKYLLRLLAGDPGKPGVARAFLSSKYKFIDNLDVLLAIMGGIRDAGVNAIPDQCDLSERRMHARFVVPEIAALAPNLLDGYRSSLDQRGGPRRAGDDGGMRLRGGLESGWTVPGALLAAAREGQGYAPGTEPVVFAGLRVSNSDVGQGARTIAPEIRVRVCRNGLTLNVAGSTKVHLGGEQEQGVVQWSADTQERELELITAQARDAVTAFLSQDFLDSQVERVESLAGVPVKDAEPTIKAVAAGAGFNKAEAAAILEHFLIGGAMTAGGVANAVTAYSQTLASPDRAAELDRAAFKALELAAARG